MLPFLFVVQERKILSLTLGEGLAVWEQSTEKISKINKNGGLRCTWQ
jgi:hypothetical protein